MLFFRFKNVSKYGHHLNNPKTSCFPIKIHSIHQKFLKFQIPI